MSTKNQFGLLRTRRFLPLFITQFLGACNDNVFRFALVIFVTFDLAEKTSLPASYLVPLSGVIFIAPFILFSYLAGQLADRYDKAALVRVVKTTEIFVMAAAAVGLWWQNVVFLFCVLFLTGAQSTFFGPLKYALLAEQLDEIELTGGNGLIQMGTTVAILLGASAGGALASITAVSYWAVATAVIAIAIAGRISAGFILPSLSLAPNLEVNGNVLSATWQLVRDSWSYRELFLLMMMISWFWFLGATVLSVVPSFAKEQLGADEQVVTLLNAALTIGIAGGALTCERLSRRKVELGLVPVAALGISMAATDIYFQGSDLAAESVLDLSALFTNPTGIRVFAALILIGACGAVYIVPLYAAIQARVEASFRARLISALNIANAIFMVASGVTTIALLAAGLSVAEIFLFLGASNAVVLAGSLYFVPEFSERWRALLAPDKR
ncbi:MAG: MFS transporter [Pseudomonadota bacterium]